MEKGCSPSQHIHSKINVVAGRVGYCYILLVSVGRGCGCFSSMWNLSIPPDNSFIEQFLAPSVIVNTVHIFSWMQSGIICNSDHYLWGTR